MKYVNLILKVLEDMPTSSSCGGLQPLAVVFLPFGQKRAYYAVVAHFRPFLVFSSNLGNF